MAGDYQLLDRVLWGTDYVGKDTGHSLIRAPGGVLKQATYLETVGEELDFYQNKLNSILKRCGWPTLSAKQIDGLLGENVRRFIEL